MCADNGFAELLALGFNAGFFHLLATLGHDLADFIERHSGER